MSITLNDNIVLTDLAYEKARLLGMSLVTAKAHQPPAAPVRPYLSKEQKNASIQLKKTDSPPTFFGSSGDSPQQTAPSFSSESAASSERQEPIPSGLTQLAKRTIKEAGPPPGFPSAFTQQKPDAGFLRKQIIESVNMRFGHIDPQLVDKIVKRALAKAGID